MKSRTKPALRALPPAQVQISLPVQGVLRDVRHAFLGLYVGADTYGAAAMQLLRWAQRCTARARRGAPTVPLRRAGSITATPAAWIRHRSGARHGTALP